MIARLHADNYYLLPFCKPQPKTTTRHKWGGLGEVLQGNELIDSQLELKFRTDLPKKDICTVTLDDEKVRGGGGGGGGGGGWQFFLGPRACHVAQTHARHLGDAGRAVATALSITSMPPCCWAHWGVPVQVEDFTEAVRRHYWYEFFADDLPIWGFVGPPPEQVRAAPCPAPGLRPVLQHSAVQCSLPRHLCLGAIGPGCCPGFPKCSDRCAALPACADQGRLQRLRLHAQDAGHRLQRRPHHPHQPDLGVAAAAVQRRRPEVHVRDPVEGVVDPLCAPLRALPRLQLLRAPGGCRGGGGTSCLGGGGRLLVAGRLPAGCWLPEAGWKRNARAVLLPLPAGARRTTSVAQVTHPLRPALQIHWFSIFNSFMMVIFLVGLVSMILLRTLRRDYARYTARRADDDDLESLERDMNEESGWKLVRVLWWRRVW